MYSLYCDDCFQVLPQFPKNSVDMVLCDLPFGQTHNHWDTEIDLTALWELYRGIVKDNGAIILFGAGMFTAKLMMSNPSMWRYNLIWHKTQPVGFLNANRMPLRAHEDIVVFYKQLPTYHPQKTDGHPRKTSSQSPKAGTDLVSGTNYGEYKRHHYDSTERYPTSILTFPTDKQKSKLHPTQKPVALCEWLIRSYTDEGDTVLDNCMGSGSTGVACIQTNRKFIGIEKDSDYFHTAQQRLEEAEKLKGNNNE